MGEYKVGKKSIRVVTLSFLIGILTLPTLVFAGIQSVDENDKSYGVGNIPEVPGLPDNVIQYNRTNTSPIQQKDQLLAGEPTLFAYQNTTMLFNSTMNCDLVITAKASTNQKIFALSVDPNQTMTLTMNFGDDPLLNEQDRDKNLNFFASIEPNATVELTAQLRLYINRTELNQELDWEVTPEKLSWMYWNGTQNEWVKVPSFIDQNGYLVCNTDHFSIWTIGETDDLTEKTQAIIDMALIYGGIGVGIVIILAIGIAVFSKRR